jgi:hypothetical protein
MSGWQCVAVDVVKTVHQPFRTRDANCDGSQRIIPRSSSFCFCGVGIPQVVFTVEAYSNSFPLFLWTPTEDWAAAHQIPEPVCFSGRAPQLAWAQDWQDWGQIGKIILREETWFQVHRFVGGFPRLQRDPQGSYFFVGHFVKIQVPNDRP